MYLLDTNHCTYAIDRQPVILERLRGLGAVTISISVITRAEFWFMSERSERVAENRIAVGAFLGQVTSHPIDDGIAWEYAVLKAALFDRFGPRARAERRRATLGHLGFSENDLWIAATALRHGLRLVSSDGDFRRVAQVVDLQVEDWHVGGPATGSE